MAVTFVPEKDYQDVDVLDEDQRPEEEVRQDLEFQAWVKTLSPECRNIPHVTLKAFFNHAHRRKPAGGFVTAVLKNDFVRAATGADTHNERRLREIAIVVANHLPAACHGSPVKVAAWLDAKT